MLKVLLIPALDDSNIELIKKSCSDMNHFKGKQRRFNTGND